MDPQYNWNTVLQLSKQEQSDCLLPGFFMEKKPEETDPPKNWIVSLLVINYFSPSEVSTQTPYFKSVSILKKMLYSMSMEIPIVQCLDSNNETLYYYSFYSFPSIPSIVFLLNILFSVSSCFFNIFL